MSPQGAEPGACVPGPAAGQDRAGPPAPPRLHSPRQYPLPGPAATYRSHFTDSPATFPCRRNQADDLLRLRTRARMLARARAEPRRERHRVPPVRRMPSPGRRGLPERTLAHRRGDHSDTRARAAPRRQGCDRAPGSPVAPAHAITRLSRSPCPSSGRRCPGPSAFTGRRTTRRRLWRDERTGGSTVLAAYEAARRVGRRSSTGRYEPPAVAADTQAVRAPSVVEHPKAGHAARRVAVRVDRVQGRVRNEVLGPRERSAYVRSARRTHGFALAETARASSSSLPVRCSRACRAYFGRGFRTALAGPMGGTPGPGR